MDRVLHKMVDKELVDRFAMDVLVRSSSVAYSPSAEAYSEGVVYFEVAYFETDAYSEAEGVVYFPCEEVVRPSSEAVPSVEVLDHNCRKMKILPRV